MAKIFLLFKSSEYTIFSVFFAEFMDKVEFVFISG